MKGAKGVRIVIPASPQARLFWSGECIGTEGSGDYGGTGLAPSSFVLPTSKKPVGKKNEVRSTSENGGSSGSPFLGSFFAMPF